MLDIYTGRNYIKSIKELDKLVAKDTTRDDISSMNPFTFAGYDIKYRLFNKNFEVHIEHIEDNKNYKDK